MLVCSDNIDTANFKYRGLRGKHVVAGLPGLDVSLNINVDVVYPTINSNQNMTRFCKPFN